MRIIAQRYFWILLVFIMIYAAFMRLYALDHYPQIFNQDEMALGYDAWSLWNTGRDQHGDLFPIHFRTFNDYVPPVANYITAPFVGLLGLNEFSTRLPAALLGIGSIFLTALLGRRWFGPVAGLLAALFLSLSSWHINYSRIAFPASFVPFFTVASLYTFTRAMTNLKSEAVSDPTSQQSKNRVWREYGWLVMSSACFALLTATYPTMKIQGPLLFGICLLAAAPLFWRHRRAVFLWMGLYLLCISPLFIDQLVRWNMIQSHFNSMSVFGYPQWPAQVIRLYTDHYNPTALLFEGFGDGMSIRPPYVGQLFWLDLPLCLVAAIGLAQGKTYRLAVFSLPILLGIWFFTYPIASSLTVGSGPTATQLGRAHDIRSYNLLPLPQLLAGYGAVILWCALKRYWWGKIPVYVLAVGGVLLIVIFNVTFVPYYFEQPWIETRAPGNTFYNIGLRPMLELVSHEAKPCDIIWMDNTNRAYIYYLFLTQYPPQRFQEFSAALPKTGQVSIGSIGNVRFAEPDPNDPNPWPLPECKGKPYRAFFLTQVKPTPSGWQEISAVRNNKGQAMWHVVVSPELTP